jgi:hypothetical protein
MRHLILILAAMLHAAAAQDAQPPSVNSAPDRLGQEIKHLFDGGSGDHLDSAMRRAMKSAHMGPEEEIALRMYGVAGLAAFALLLAFCCGCVAMCICAPEMYDTFYCPLVRCSARALCFPVWIPYRVCGAIRRRWRTDRQHAD